MRESLLLLGFLTFAAILEVWGDATIRKWAQEGAGVWAAVVGCAMLAAYGIVVNRVRWDLAKLLGIYVVFFAVTGVLWGRFVRKEVVPWTTWAGLVLIVAGGAVIQWAPRLTSSAD